MKAILALLIGIGLMLNAFAQSIAIKGGASFPVGSYANASLANSDNAFASTGGFGAFAVTYPVYKKINLCAEAGFASQGLKEDKLQSELQSLETDAQVTVDVKKGYRSSYALAGGCFLFPKNKLEFGLKAMVGFTNLQTPEYTTAYQFTTNTGNVYTASQSAMSFAIAWGFHIGYQLPKNIQILLSLDNMYSSFSYKKSYISSDQEYTHVDLQVYQLGLGVAYGF